MNEVEQLVECYKAILFGGVIGIVLGVIIYTIVEIKEYRNIRKFNKIFEGVDYTIIND